MFIKKLNAYFNFDASLLLCVLLFKMDVKVVIFEVIIVFARELGEKPFDFTFIGGLSDVGVDSAELFIGDSDGTCGCLMLNVFGGFGGGDGVTDLDSVSLVYLSKL